MQATAKLSFDSKAQRLFSAFKPHLRELLAAYLYQRGDAGTLSVESVQHALGWALQVMEDDPVELPGDSRTIETGEAVTIAEFRNGLRGLH